MLFKGVNKIKLNFRSLFKKIFGKRNELNNLTAAKLLNSYNNIYTPFDGNAYDDATVRDCIDTIARHFGKMKPKHVVKENGKIIKVADDKLNYLLGNCPNPLMTTSEFLEKIIAQYFTYNNIFIYIQYDDFTGEVKAIYPLNFSLLEIFEDNQNVLYVRFTFGNGERTTVPYEDIIHIRRHFNRDDFFGEDNSRIMLEDLSTLKAVKIAIINAVKNFTALRGILKWKAAVRAEDMKKANDSFVNMYASNNPSGIASLDTKADFQQLTTTVTTFNSQQMAYARDCIYKHFGISENIIMGKYTEDEYIAFFESVLEPIAIKLAQELTDKLFTKQKRSRGNEIILETNRLSFMAVASKIKTCETLIPSGALTVNEIREIFGYAGIEGGDDRLISLNFVKAKDQTLYQTGKEEQQNTNTGGDDDGQQAANAS